MTVVHKVSTEGAGKLEFVLSDATIDRYGDSIDPKGWDLKAFKQNPIALFGHSNDFPIGNWSDLRIQGGKLIGKLNLAARGTSARIDELISLVEQGVLRAVSVGFIPKKSEPIDPDKPYAGQKYISQELIETSLVSVPANPAALQIAKSLHVSDETMSLAFGEYAGMRQRGMPNHGEHAAKPLLKKVAPMSSLAKRIEDASNELTAARDTLTAHIEADDGDDAQTETLAGEIEVREQRLSSLQRAEKALAARAANPGTSLVPAAPHIRKPLGLQMKEPKPEDLIIRAAVVKVLAHATGKQPEQILEERYRDHEATQIVVRAAISGATTTTTGWAAELVETAMGAWLDTLRPISVYPQLAALGTSLSFGPGRGAIKLPSRTSTPSISGSFVAEGSPIPVRRIGLTSGTLSPHKMGVISVFTKELAKYSNPQIEGLLRQEIQADTALTIDSLLLDAVAGSSTRPAGLTNGVTALAASAAGGYAAILADINTLAAAFDTANAGRRLALLMNTAEARMLAMAPGPDGRFGWADQFLSEFTIIKSTTIPAGQVYMIDAADFATAVGDAPEFETSEQAVLHMEDSAPAQISAAGTPNTVAAPVQSMFQTAQIALRMLMDISWGMRRAGMVQWIDNVDWAPNT